MRILQHPYRRDVLIIAAAALAVRILVLPWSHTVHADAVSRIHIAYEWLLDPHYIREGYWGPLHHYLNAFSMLLLPGKVAGPVALNILFASLTAVPLYGFTLNTFGSRRGAVFAALLYVFAPMVMWTSLQALSEVGYGFFLAMTLFALSEGVRNTKGMGTALGAGLLLTCAAALRYEAWVLIAVLTGVVFLLRGWRYTAIFWAASMVFPATWMIGNHLEFGDALYSVNQNDVWNMAKEGINDDVTPVLRTQRALFFPWSFMLNVSPLCGLLLLAGMIRAIVKRRLGWRQWLWLLPFVVMAVVFQRKAWDGSLMLHHRFVVTWLVLLLPFMALVFLGAQWTRLRNTLMIVGLASVVPLSFVWNRVYYTERFGEGRLWQALDELTMANYRELEVVPRLPGPETEVLLGLINLKAVPGEGLLLDFHGWDRTYHLLLHALPNTMVVGGAKHEEYHAEEVAAFLSKHRSGLLLLSRTGMLRNNAEFRGVTVTFEGTGIPLVADAPFELRGLRLIRYSVIAPDDPRLAQATTGEPWALFPQDNDAEYYNELIRNDERWYNRVKRQAHHDGVPVDTALHRNVLYMLEREGGR